MFAHIKAFRWPIVAVSLITVVMLFTLQFDRVPVKSASSFDAASFISNEEHYKLQVQESVLNLSRVDQLSSKYDIAVTHPPLQWTEQDLAFFTSAAGETVFSQLALIPEAHLPPNFATITAAERLFKALFLHFDKILAKNPDQDVQHDPSWTFFKRLEDALYPWIHPYWDNAFHINNQTSGKGIVLCVGNNQFKFAASTIRAIRQVYHNDLPIEVFFIRENDLDIAKRHYLTSEFDNLTLMKLDDYVDDYYTKFGGWAMKPFAMLASRFSEMIMMDADVFFFQDPGMLFDDEGYKMTGSLFYYDRTLFPNWTKGPDWMRSFLPTMSSFVPKSRWFRGLSSHEQESGVVVMDKRKALLGLLSTCKMNGVTERDEVVYKHVHGDKETYWVGFEVTQTPYAFVKSYAGVIGSHGRGDADGSPEAICGNQIHLDADGRPLWLNGGLYRNKHAKDGLEYLNFTHFSTGDDWDFGTNCIKNKDTVHDLDPVQRVYALASIEIDKKRMIDQELLDKNEWKFKDAM
ncbi:glycosyltransferase family 71 protein [Mucor lusitanicus]|uniref:Glycosyltransferase family 71 protein n=1 Tax=Mucor lusitanicus CBS 277.49 TaxID=747725 RepID=A0A162MSG7_MUCCL|nr:glycosyltransferase family 71 protein [Mucor lusitanicus CBS 277.49]